MEIRSVANANGIGDRAYSVSMLTHVKAEFGFTDNVADDGFGRLYTWAGVFRKLLSSLLAGGLLTRFWFWPSHVKQPSTAFVGRNNAEYGVGLFRIRRAGN